MAGGDQQPVLLSIRNLELLEHSQQHLPAGLRPARLHEAQMAGRDPGLEREFELGQAPALAPLAEGRPDLGLKLNSRHCAATLARDRRRVDYLEVIWEISYNSEMRLARELLTRLTS